MLRIGLLVLNCQLLIPGTVLVQLLLDKLTIRKEVRDRCIEQAGIEVRVILAHLLDRNVVEVMGRHVMNWNACAPEARPAVSITRPGDQ